MKIQLKEDVFQFGNGRVVTYYKPWIDVFLISRHKIGKPVACYIDSGASVTIFPMDYAYAFLGFSSKSIKKGVLLNLMGVGGAETESYGHLCTIQHPEFCIKDVLIFFVDNQPFPLLGRIGFMENFAKIIFHEEDKLLELIPKSNK